MNLVSANAAISNITNTLSNIEIGPRGLYKSSKDRILNIKAEAKQIIDLCEKLVPSEGVDSDISEVDTINQQSNSISTENLTALLATLQSACSTIEQALTGTCNESSSGNADDSFLVSSSENIEILEFPLNDQRKVKLTAKNTETSSITKSMRKQGMAVYSEMLSKFSNLDTGYHEADECGELISNWFNARFSNPSHNFKYSIAKIPQWICDIVCCYAYYASINQSDKFVSRFNSWIYKLSTEHSSYAIPYEVFEYIHSSDCTSKYPVSALLIWDILLDEGMREATSTLCPELRIDRDIMISVLGRCYQNVPPKYTELLSRSDVRRIYKMSSQRNHNMHLGQPPPTHQNASSSWQIL